MSSIHGETYVNKRFASERTKKVGKAVLYTVLVSLTWAVFALMIYALLVGFSFVEAILVGINTDLLATENKGALVYFNTSIDLLSTTTVFLTAFVLGVMGVRGVIRQFRTHEAWYLHPVVPIYRKHFTELGRWVSGDPKLRPYIVWEDEFGIHACYKDEADNY